MIAIALSIASNFRRAIKLNAILYVDCVRTKLISAKMPFRTNSPIRPPPATYFARHYYNDPHRDASLVRVASFGDDERIVASCRVFQRTIVAPLGVEGVIDAGGIGEVCTLAEHRRRGLSSQLLQQAFSVMISLHSSAPLTARNMKLSFLHSAPAFFSVYQKAGCVSIRSRWSVIGISMSNGPDDESRNFVQAARFPEDTTTLQALHRQYSETRFVGCIIRSDTYWNDYLSKELENLFVLKAYDSRLDVHSLKKRSLPAL